MLELLSMLRPLSTWQMLLGVCLLDLALIAMRLSWSGQTAVSHQEELQQHRLRQLLDRHTDLAQKVADSRRELEESRRQMQLLIAARVAQEKMQAEQLRVLSQGVEDVESGVAALLAKQARKTRGRQNASHIGSESGT